MTINTWEKDSHGLYDYEAQRTNREYFEVQGPCKMFRNWHGTSSFTQAARPLSSPTTR